MEKLQIREITDIQGNTYKIYDYMILTFWGGWRSVNTYFDLDIALKEHIGIEIEDLTEL